MLTIDLDAFKLVNDSLGLEGGDLLLREVAERLTSTVRETDTLARRGGDEFLVLLADLERGEVGDMQAPLLFAETVAGRIRDALAKPFDLDGTEVFVTASIGISLFPDDAGDVQALLVHSESAMVSSKRAGPGNFAVSDVASFDSSVKFSFVQKLRRAVERREWELHYQPVVQLATGAIKGVEALVRWRTQDGELIPPNEFIPLAEELGLIEPIGEWVVDEIVRQDQQWRREGILLEMGFNLSPKQFWQPDLSERILARLAERRMDPNKVVLEVTETSAMRDPDRAQAILTDLHAHGLRLALDDFGTGYSSLWRLRQPPGRHPQDRPLVRRARRHGPAGGQDRRRVHPARTGAGDDDPRRGHRDRGRVALPRRAGVRARPGLLLQPPGARGRDLGTVPHGRARPRRRLRDYARPMAEPPAQRNLVLILARSFASRLATAVLILDEEGRIVYFNEAAEGLLGVRFVEGHGMSLDESRERFRPSDDEGNLVPFLESPIGIAVGPKEPAHSPLMIRGIDGVERRLEVTAFPLFAHAGEFVGAIAFFWER